MPEKCCCRCKYWNELDVSDYRLRVGNCSYPGRKKTITEYNEKCRFYHAKKT